ncbi:Uncharacterized protein TPAR_04716 [Tolypocladium paradoxum]|uniref:C2H2-type domain-containing protein n=1 Tax=Tolypocladium paradoxum TaxID=94208 RepID=A0A2S4KY54_9HYPO|nr:Uncharacterized protein TPAR_04716 [Tolypocladium paradoxum]
MDDESDMSSRVDRLRPCAENSKSHLCGRNSCSQKLGDFAKLQSHTATLHLEHSPRSGSSDASVTASMASGVGDYHPLEPSTHPNGPAKLGDFLRLFAQLQAAGPAVETRDQKCYPQFAFSPSSMPCANVSYVVGEAAAPRPIRTCSPGKPFDGPSGSDSDLEVCSESDDGVDNGAFMPSTTPPSSTDLDAPPLARSTERRAVPKSLGVSTQAQKRRLNVGHVLPYQRNKCCPLVTVYDKMRSRDQKNQSLSLGIGPLRAMDGLRAERYPVVVANGIHVFLDMSNINIGFQQALRRRYSISERARFTPLPPLDLQFLTEILVRGRRAVALNVGCSVLPGKPEPRYVQQLRDLGYHVDLRDRKRVADGVKSPCRRRPGAGASSDEMPAATGTVRYVEDLVDETLQTRIAESVMEYSEKQGTLVLATGDAQPAKYSDGFFAYADRALKMGWNIEVASWKSSLSSHWKSSEWTAKWADRFRIIELDDFVDELLASHG